MWFDWRMIPVMAIVLVGFVAAAVGAISMALEALFGFPTPPGLAQAGVTSTQVFVGGLIVLVAGFGLGYWCKHNPDAGT